jgi:hypothetical protein
MKRTTLKTIKQTFLAVPAAALMLGASQAQTTVGLNFQSWYYDSGTTPQTIGYGAGYQTTGFPVTAKAFGIATNNWFNADPLPSQAPTAGPATFNGATVFAGSLTANVTAPDAWQSGIGEQTAGFNASPAIPETVAPGNNEATWSYLDDGNTTGDFSTVTISGLAAVFPNGYVIQTIASGSGAITFNNVDFTDDATFTNVAVYSTYQVTGPDPNADRTFGTVGLSAQSVLLTNDTINVNAEPKTANSRSSIAAIILTDKPVVTQDPTSSTNNDGAALILNGSAIGILPLSYQWRLNGAPISGATNASYTNANLSAADAGNYDLVVTNSYGSAVSAEAAITVNVNLALVTDLASSTNFLTMTRVLNYAVGGAPPITYSWTKNGQPLSDTTSSLVLTNLQASNQGAYQVVASNPYGSITSSVANVTVISSLPPYEGFNYSAGDINGENGGIGWTNAWSQPVTATLLGGHAVVTPGLNFSPSVSSLVTSGAALETAVNGSADFADNRSMLAPLGGPGAGTVYFSFIGQFTNSGWEVISLYSGTNEVAYVGEGWYNAGWGCGSPGSFPFPEIEETTKLPATLSFVVYRFDFTATNTQVRVYVNPSSLETEPATPDATGTLGTSFQFDTLQVKAHQYPMTGSPCGVLDELRFGSTWSSVAPYTARTSPPFTLQFVQGGVILDTKPAGTLHDGLNRGTTWLASSTGTNIFTLAPGDTRTGVEQFVETNASQISIPADADFNTTNGTISFWMQYPFPGADVLPGGGAEAAMLFDRRTTNGLVITLNEANTTIELQSLEVVTNVNRNVTTIGNDSVADGLWHHVAVTYDQSASGLVTLYVDGVQDMQVSNAGPWSWPTNQEIELGRSHDPYWFIYDGQMDDFRIYNRILTPAEIATIGTESTSDTLVDTNALKVRYNFDSDSAFFGHSIVYPYGILTSSPVLGPGAMWTPVTNAVSPQPILISAPSMFYRLTGTP